jgi:hypothetical protein
LRREVFSGLARHWDYADISLSPQRIRGPYTTTATTIAAA